MPSASYPSKLDVKAVCLAFSLSLLALLILALGLRWCIHDGNSRRVPAEHQLSYTCQSSNEPQWGSSSFSSSAPRTRVRRVVSRLQHKKDAASANVFPWLPATRAGRGLRGLRSRRARALRARARLARVRSARSRRRCCRCGRISKRSSWEREDLDTCAASVADGRSERRPQQVVPLSPSERGSYGEAHMRDGRSDTLSEHKKVAQSTDRQLFGLQMLQKATTVRIQRSGSSLTQENVPSERGNNLMPSSSRVIPHLKSFVLELLPLKAH